MAAAAVATSSLGWQMALYRLSGSRVKVRLTPAAMNAMGTTWRSRTIEQFVDPPKYPSLLNWPVGRDSIMEFAEITVANVGRTATSVSEISLDLGVNRVRFHRPRYTVAGIPVPLDKVITSLPVRLEPGSEVVILFDLWAFLPDAIVANRPGRPRVRASARINVRRSRRSPFFSAWRISSGQTRFDGKPLTLDGAIYRALFRGLLPADDEDDAKSNVSDRLAAVQFAWGMIRSNLRSAAAMGEVGELLRPYVADDLRRVNVGWQIWHTIDTFRRDHGPEAIEPTLAPHDLADVPVDPPPA